MTQGKQPDFKGDGVAVWVNEKDGKVFLSIKLVGHDYVLAFKNEPKPAIKKDVSALIR